MDTLPQDKFKRSASFIGYFSTLTFLVFLFIVAAKPVRAATETVRPDGDVTSQWTPTPSGSHYTTIDEDVTQPTAGDTDDYLSGTNSTSDQFTMETISAISSVSTIEVWVYGYMSKPGTMSVDIIYDGSLQHASNVSLGTSYGWASTSVTGLSLSQSQLDSLEIVIIGDQGGRDYYVATLYVEVTYTSSKTEQLHFRWRNDDGTEATATWKAVEDSSSIGNIDPNSVVRLRFESANTGGGAESAARPYEVQWGEKLTDCASISTWTGLADSTDGWDMATSQLVEGSSTTAQLLNSEGYTFTAGEQRETADTTGSIGPLSASYFTEIEYSFKPTSYTDAGTTYCFRLYDTSAGAPLDNYAAYPEATVANVAPVVSNVSLNGGSAIDLTEGTTTAVSITATVTDQNGCEDVFSSGSITARIYRSGVGDSCSADDNNCYVSVSLSESGDTCSGAGDTSGDATGTVNIQFHAQPTDDGSPWSGDNWISKVTATDSGSNFHSSFSLGVELNTLRALSVTSSISYGTLLVGENTGSVNQEVVVTSTGNAVIDFELSGTDMTSGGNTILVSQQEYSLLAFTYGGGTALSGSATPVEAELPKPTTSPSDSIDTAYWGMGIPSESGVGGYTGENTFSAVAD